VAAIPFASFKKKQLTLEVRYGEAYLLWDNAGAVSNRLRKLFKDFKNAGAAPNRVAFNADQRYVLNVELNRAAIIDHIPDRNPDKTFDLFSDFADLVTATLEVHVFDRIGTRFLYSLECKSAEEARTAAKSFGLVATPTRELFNIKPTSMNPGFKVEADDGELGYVLQLYTGEIKFEFNPAPDVVALDVRVEDKTTHQLIIDLDFMTKKPMKVESFDVKTWLMGWQRAVNRDTDDMLNIAINPK
jgi:hypothetical protein